MRSKRLPHGASPYIDHAFGGKGMAKKNTTVLEVPVNFSASISVPKNACKAIDDSIKRGEMSLEVALASKDSDSNFMFSVYPDQFEGSLHFSRAGSELVVKANGTYKLAFGTFERDNIQFPVDIRAYAIGDANADSYQLAEDDSGLPLGEIVNVPK